jgi:hypothetical protein
MGDSVSCSERVTQPNRSPGFDRALLLGPGDTAFHMRQKIIAFCRHKGAAFAHIDIDRRRMRHHRPDVGIVRAPTTRRYPTRKLSLELKLQLNLAGAGLRGLPHPTSRDYGRCSVEYGVMRRNHEVPAIVGDQPRVVLTVFIGYILFHMRNPDVRATRPRPSLRGFHPIPARYRSKHPIQPCQYLHVWVGKSVHSECLQRYSGPLCG